jgi:hypothetical protein
MESEIYKRQELGVFGHVNRISKTSKASPSELNAQVRDIYFFAGL